MKSERQENQAAFQKAKQELENRFPHGHFVAFAGGKMIADAPSFDELTTTLATIEKDGPDVFVVQTGVDYPDEVFVLL